MAGKARKYYDKFKFRVEIDGVTQAGFSKAGPLKGSVEEIEHYEGGALLPDKSPGRGKFDDLSLEYGATDNMELYDWFKSVLDAAQETGGADPDDYKRNLSIVQLDRAGNEVQRFNVYGAWPKEFEAGDWDNSANEKVIRKVTLVYDYYEPV